MEYKEFTGKTVEEAVEIGLKELGIERKDADVRVLEEGKKKLFGYVKARVEIASKIPSDEFEGDCKTNSGEGTKKESTSEEKASETKFGVRFDEQGRTDGERAVKFLEGLFDLLNIAASTELVKEGEKIEINVTASNTNAIIGKRGAMLDAIQTVTGAVANTGREDYKRVVVDCENYRENREQTLQKLALKLAEKAVRFEKKIRLEPMNPYERRIIHAALSGREDVTTQSEGKEPHRYIVIVPSYVRYPDRPASPAREERPQRGYSGRGYNNNNRNNENRNGYNKKPYNRDGGYKKPFNRDGDGYRKPYNKEFNKREEGGTNMNGERRGYDRSRSSSSYKKSSSDFFGTYLGNSKDGQDKE